MGRQTRVGFSVCLVLVLKLFSSKQRRGCNAREGKLGSVVGGSARSPRPTPWQILWPALEEAVKENALLQCQATCWHSLA